jgi:hypothetical protein
MRLTGAIIPQGNWQGCKQQTVKEAGAMVIVCHSMQSHSDTHDYGGLDLSSMFRKSRPRNNRRTHSRYDDYTHYTSNVSSENHTAQSNQTVYPRE